MKKRIVSLLCAGALILGLTGCTISSTPTSVGSIGDVDISAGMYLLSQYQGYFSALEAARKQTPEEGEELPDYSSMSVKEFMKETITVDGEEVSAADKLAADTLKNVQYYAAVNTAFSALNGELTEQQIQTADANAKSVWDANPDLYKKNGFSLATVQEYQYTLAKADALLDMVYGENGTNAVSEEDLQAHLSSDLWYMHTANVPLYNAETFQTTEENTAKATEMASSLLELYEADSANTGNLYELFRNKMIEGLPPIYDATGNPFAPENAIGTDLLDETMLTSYFSEESAQKIRDMKFQDAVMVADSGFAIEFFQRVDPVATGEWPAIRDQAMAMVYGRQLQDELTEYGTTLENGLDSAATRKLPAGKIVPAMDNGAQH